jgi:hypothetical protein
MLDRVSGIRLIKGDLRLGICDEKIRQRRFPELRETDWLSLLREAYAEFKAEGHTYTPRDCIKTALTCSIQS